MFVKFALLIAFASCVLAQKRVLNIHGGNTDEDIPEGPPTSLSYGMFNIIASCDIIGRSVSRCGRKSTTKSACRRHNCCWNLSNQNLNLPVCFQPKMKIQNYQAGTAWQAWGSWGTCLGKELCVAGKQFRFRKCDGVPGTGGCSGTWKESQDCTTAGCTVVATAAWGAWGSYSTCTVPSEPTCFTGFKTRTRSCMLVSSVVTSTSCSGSSSETAACDSSLCQTSGSWVAGACSVTCGSGTFTSTRTCLTGGSGSPSSCFTKTETCTQSACGNTDPDLDIVIMIDGTELTDNCKQKELDLNVVAPFTGSVFTSANFPNFFQQKGFLTSFMAEWSTVTSATTRLAVQKNCGSCSYATQTNFNAANFLSTTLTQTIIDVINFPCDVSDIFGTMICVNDGQFITANGERTGNKNVGIFMIPRFNTVPNYLVFLNDAVLTAIKGSLTNIDKILILSTVDISTLTTAEQTTEISMLNQLGCFTTNPGTCTAYIGNIFESTATVVNRMRALV
uniref:uncharacterized protein LOC120348486 n=1 Tax=Styela clava TaxID=7725 RepID=UPI00193ABBB1|nr:uncharacterized protein LOC120348486 [Styela clava]